MAPCIDCNHNSGSHQWGRFGLFGHARFSPAATLGVCVGGHWNYPFCIIGLFEENRKGGPLVFPLKCFCEMHQILFDEIHSRL